MALVEDLKILLKKKNYSVTSVAKAINLSNATLHLWMNNNYKGNVKKIEDAVAKFLEIEKLREGRIKVDFVKTTVVDDVFDIAKTCHVENEIGVCYGDAGIGKTFAVKKYAIDNKVPIMQDDGIDFLTTFIIKNQINSVLEIGTAIGYSAIMMALANPKLKITTI